ncbi:MAG: cellulase family glycosylhydrolase, partial [Terriglobia bacterium]
VNWLIDKYEPRGKHIPIIAGEWGYPSTPNWFDMSDEGQAKMLAREFLTNIAEGVPITIWYDWHDDGADPKDPNLHYGVVRNAIQPGGDPVYAPKPAYFASQTLARFFSGYTFHARLAVGGSEDYMLLFTRGRDARLAAWTTSKASHEITIPGARGKFRVTGFEGAKMQDLRAHRGSLKINLSDTPQYLAPLTPSGLSRLTAGKKAAQSKHPN